MDLPNFLIGLGFILAVRHFMLRRISKYKEKMHLEYITDELSMGGGP